MIWLDSVEGATSWRQFGGERKMLLRIRHFQKGTLNDSHLNTCFAVHAVLKRMDEVLADQNVEHAPTTS